jgi:hypothetical protein
VFREDDSTQRGDWAWVKTESIRNTAALSIFFMVKMMVNNWGIAKLLQINQEVNSKVAQ